MNPFSKRNLIFFGIAAVVIIASFALDSLTPRHDTAAYSGKLETLELLEATKLPNTLRDYRKNADLTLVFMYTGWCPVCERAFPQTMALAERYKSAGLAVMGLSVDSEPGRTEAFLNRKGEIPFNNYQIAEAARGDFMSTLETLGITYNNGVPYVVLLDKSGKIIAQGNYTISSMERLIQPMLRHKDALKKDAI